MIRRILIMMLIASCLIAPAKSAINDLAQPAIQSKVQLGESLLEKGLPHRAIKAFHEAREQLHASPATNVSWQVRAQLGLTHCYIENSQFDAANQSLQAAKQLIEAHQLTGSLATQSLLTRAKFELANSQLDAAETALKQAQQSLEQVDKNANLKDQLSLLNYQADLAAARGDMSTAVQYLQKALEQAHRGKVSALTYANAQLALGKALFYSGKFEPAAALFEAALPIYEHQTPDGLARSEALFFLARLTMSMGQLSCAEDLFHYVLEQRQAIVPDSLIVAQTYAGLAEVTVRQKKYSISERYQNEALRIRAQLAPEQELIARSWYGLGKLLERTHRLEEAQVAYREGLRLAVAHLQKSGGSATTRAKALLRRMHHFEALMRVQLALGATQDAFLVLNQLHTLRLHNLLHERDLTLDLPTSLRKQQQALNAELDQTMHQLMRADLASQPDQLARIQQDYRQLQQQRDALVHEIRATSPRYAQLNYPQPPAYNQVTQSLDNKTAILTFFVSYAQVHAFVVTKNNPCVATVLAIPLQKLNADVAGLRGFIAKPDSAMSQQFMHDAASDLFEQLIAPLSTHLQGISHLQIMADGPLNLLPFPALRGSLTPGQPAQYLIEQVTLTMIPHAPSSPTSSTASQKPQRLVAFGNPDYGVTATPKLQASLSRSTSASPQINQRSPFADLSPLPYSQQEIAAIAKSFPSTRVYTQQAAQESHFKALRGKVDLLHFSCHAFLAPEFPMRSALLLTPQVSGKEDGILQAREIIEASQAQWGTVVLSGCETGLNDANAGMALLSLTGAFRVAGARNIVASLWKVSDYATTALMSHFYNGLQQNLDIAAALQQAQVHMIQSASTAEAASIMKHPYYWSAFQNYAGSEAKPAASN